MYQNEIEIIKSRIENKHQGDEKQLEIIFSPNKRLLVEAPAGYGKTHTMVSRIAYLISIGKLPVPKKLLALTFSVNAAYKIKKDVSKNIPELLQDLGKQINIKEKIYVSNYHGFCRSILKKYGHRLHPALSNLDTLQSVDDSRSDSIMRIFNNISIDEANVLSEFNAGVKNIKGKYIKNICKEIKNSLPKIDVVTIAISPEFCNGWGNAFNILRVITTELDIYMPYKYKRYKKHSFLF